MKDTEKALLNLRDSIVIQATCDYLDAKKKIYRINNGYHRYQSESAKERGLIQMEAMLIEVTDFFYSDWYKELSGIPADILINKLDKVYEEWVRTEGFKKKKARFFKKILLN